MFKGLPFVKVYMDDFVVASSDVNEHFENLDALLKRCVMHNVKLKMSKCVFFRKQADLLGHVVTPTGIRPQADKVKAIQEMERPRTKKQLQSFLGVVQFYKGYIPDMATKCQPLYALTKKNAPWGEKGAWTAECMDAFQYIKAVLSEAPVMAYPDLERPFYVRTDASNYGIGGTLIQFHGDQPKIIEYWSRSLTKAERNYSATKREALAITMAILRWRHFLEWRKFEVLTDHRPLLAFPQSQQTYLERWRLKLAPSTSTYIGEKVKICRWKIGCQEIRRWNPSEKEREERS